VTAPTITIVGKPSAALAKSIVSDEKKRIAAQKEALGEQGLKVEELKQAQAFNEREIPREVLEGFTVPSVSRSSGNRSSSKERRERGSSLADIPLVLL
jgi:Zn-dependent M16 (insulinase) family peptidase